MALRGQYFSLLIRQNSQALVSYWKHKEAMPTLKEMLDQFIEDGVLTREEHDLFIDAISADGRIDQEERAQITRMFQLIRDGKLKVVDEEREASEIRKRRDATKALQEKLKSA